MKNVEEVTLHQSFFGRLFGYGTLTVRGTGVAIIEFPILARPVEISRELETAVVKANNRS